MDDATQETQPLDQTQVTDRSAQHTAADIAAAAQANGPVPSPRPTKEPAAPAAVAPAADLNKFDLSQLQGFSFGTKWESKPEEKREPRRGDNYGSGGAGRRGFGDNNRDRRAFANNRENRNGGETRSGDAAAPAQRDRRGFRKPQGTGAAADFAARSEVQSGGAAPQERRTHSGSGDRRQAGASLQGARRGGPAGASGHGGRFFQQNREVPPPPYDSPHFAVSFYPEDSSFAALAKTIRSSYRTLELFEIARTVVAKNDRFIALLTRKPSANPAADGEAATRQPIYIARPDGVPFDSEEAVINYVISQHIGQFFETEQVQVDPPKGNFQVINRCGVTGELLGPPNYHRYNQIVQQHFDARIKHLSFEAFRAKIETLRDEAAVAEWLEKMKTVTRYTWRGNAKKKSEPSAPKAEEPSTQEPKAETEAATEAVGTSSETHAAESEEPKSDTATSSAEVPATQVEGTDLPPTSGTQENSVEDTSAPPATEAESADAGRTLDDGSAAKAVLRTSSGPAQEKGLCETFDSLEEAKVYLLTHARDKVYRTSDTARFHGNLLEKLPDGEIRRAIEGALERQRRFPLDTANGLRGRLRREHFTIFKKGSKGISYVCAVKRKFRTPGQTFADSISALIDFIEKNPMVLVSELPERFLGIKTAPQAPAEAATNETSASNESASQAPAVPTVSAESAKDSVAEREALHRLQLDLRWLVTEGYVTEFIDGRLFAAPPVPESRKHAAESADTPDLENFPDAPPPAPSSAPAEAPVSVEASPSAASEPAASEDGSTEQGVVTSESEKRSTEPSAEPAPSSSLSSSDTQTTTS